MDDRLTAIQVCGLWKSFGDQVVLRGIDLTVPAGEGVALVGANGSGKSTLLRCLASVLRPQAGEVRWFGRAARGNLAVRRLIGLVAHESFLYPHLTLRENLLFAARMCDVPEPGARADELLRRTGLERHARRLPGETSAGMQRRVSLARALVHEPPILLLDEPFAGLDAQGTAWLFDLLSTRRSRGGTLVFATHDLAHARRLADRVLELRMGRLQEAEMGRGDVWGDGPPLARAA